MVQDTFDREITWKHYYIGNNEIISVKLKSPVIFYLQNILNFAFTHQLILPEIIKDLIRQIVDQMPLESDKIILEEWEIELKITVDDALTILVLSNIDRINEERVPVGPMLWASIAKALRPYATEAKNKKGGENK